MKWDNRAPCPYAPMHFALLLATLAALLSGPLLYVVARPRPALLAFLDGFVLVSIAGLVLIEAVPGAFSDGGLWSLGFLLLGLLGPTALEHLLTRARREAHLLALGLAVLGLILHSLGDGAALSPGGEHGHEALALAVAIHSIPVGLVVWWLLFPVFGAWLPALALAGMAAATVVGYRYGLTLNGLLGEQTWAWFQALIAGSILHVIFGRPHLEEDSEHHLASPPWEGLGNLAGFAVLAVLAAGHGHAHEEAALADELLPRLLALALQLAPALLLAYGVSGLLMALVPERRAAWLQRATKAGTAAAGMPPLLAQARQLAPPVLSVIAVIMSLPLLGVELSVLRVAGIILLATVVGSLLARAAKPAQATPAHGHHHAPHHHAEVTRWQRGLRAAASDLIDLTAPWVLAGLLIAALLLPHADAIAWSQWPPGLAVVLFALLGLPFWLCPTGITPVMAALIATGLSPGAGLAFLLTGPALGFAAFTPASRRQALVFMSLVAAGAIALGWSLDALLPHGAYTAMATDAFGLLHYASLALLAGLYAASLLRKGGRSFLADLFENGTPHRH